MRSHSTEEQRMAELQHLMALPPQGLLQLAGDEIENRWARAPALKTVREAEHSGRGVDSALRLAYEMLIDLDAGVDEEGMMMLGALKKRLSKRGRRMNPRHLTPDEVGNQPVGAKILNNHGFTLERLAGGKWSLSDHEGEQVRVLTDREVVGSRKQRYVEALRMNPRSQRLRRAVTVMSTPDKHQLKILIDTVKNPLKGMFLGGPSAQEAKVMLREKFHYTDEEIKEMKEVPRRNPSLKARKVNPSFMQPQVFRGDVLVVDTDDGTHYIPGDDAKSRASLDWRFLAYALCKDSNASPEEVNTAVAEFLGMDEGSVSDVSIEKGKWLARSSAPGYMDATDYSMFDSEQKAWSYLIDMDPSLFTWTVELTASDEEGGTAHIYMASDAAAKAMKADVQSINGSNLERDGDFVYVTLSGNGEAVMDELDSMGFSTEEG